MNKTSFILLFVLFSLLRSVSVNSQTTETNNDKSVQDTVPRTDSVSAESIVPVVETDTRTERRDTVSADSDSIVIKRGKVKEEVEKTNTLETYFFPDSAMSHKTIVWTFNKYLNYATLGRIDSTMSGNRTELPIYKGTNTGATFLGITGSAALNHNYFERKTSDIFFFADSYNHYFRTPDQIEFYNTKGPYTQLAYYTSGNKRISEDNLDALYTQNITPEFNFGLSYVRRGAKGNYQNQATKNKSFSLFGSYIGKRYAAHAGYLFNGADNRENGGIVDDYFLVDTTLRPDAIDVKLKTASANLTENTYFLTHSYGIPLNIFKNSDSLKSGEGTTVFFGHSFEYSRYRRIYTDSPTDTIYRNLHVSVDELYKYYDNYYISASKSFDSVFASQTDNRIFVRLQPYSSTAIISQIDGGIGYRFDKYYLFEPDSYLTGKSAGEKLSTGYVYGNGQGMFGKYFKWNAFLKYYFSGYRQHDLLLDASARISFYPVEGGIHLTGRFAIDNREQSYYVKRYYSNHLKWNNDFDKTTETKIGVTLSIPRRELQAGFDNSIISKQVYFDADALPQQTSDVLNITGLYIRKNLSLRPLHLDVKLLFQITSNSNVIPLPTFSGNAALYIQSEWIKNVLDAQIGFDLYYNTEFNDYAYNPAAGVFHTQNEKKIGGYPWIDLFASFKWKRANICVKFTNVAEGIIGERDYFSALRYPRNPRMFKMGVNWRFVN